MNAPLQRTSTQDRWSWAVLWLFFVLFLLLNTTYTGIGHDAVLYTFQSLVHLHPELFSNDIFVRFGSQDDFTLFTRLYAPVVGWLGAETSAKVATLVCLLFLLWMSWRLARAALPHGLAVLGMVFLAALPDDYGPGGLFHVVEAFITPRLAAEAFALGGIVAILGNRLGLSLLLLVLSTLMHPVMAMPGWGIMLCLRLPRVILLRLIVIAFAALAVMALIGRMSWFDPLRLDAEWREVIDLHGGYLFVSTWEFNDWMRTAAALATLGVGARFVESEVARRLCIAAIITAVAGVAIALVLADWLEFALVLQGQGYRWLWPAVLLAALLLPAIGQSLWRAGAAARATLLVLAALWVARDDSLAPPLLVILITFAVVTASGRANAVHTRWMQIAAGALLALAALAAIAGNLFIFEGAYEDTWGSTAVDQLRSFCADGVLPVAVVLAALALMARSGLGGAITTTVLLAIGSLALAPDVYATWGRVQFSDALFASFEPWRARIPPRSEVIWIESPESLWLLLQRPGYFSVQQTGSAMFSRGAALELLKREKELLPYMLQAGISRESSLTQKFMGTRSTAPQSLAQICASVSAPFLISRAKLAAAPIATAPPGVTSGYAGLKLYSCAAEIKLTSSGNP
jgi:hypothetical protein